MSRNVNGSSTYVDRTAYDTNTNNILINKNNIDINKVSSEAFQFQTEGQVADIASNVANNTTSSNNNASDITILASNINTLDQVVADLSYSKYIQTSLPLIVSDTNQDFSLVTSGKGSLNFPANSIKQGDSYHIRIAGEIQTENKNQELLFIVGVISNGLLFNTSYIDLDNANNTGYPFELEIDIVFKTVGISAIVESSGFLYYMKGSGRDDARGWGANTLRENMNTTVAINIGISAKWETAAVNNALTIRQLSMTKTF